MKTRQGFVSNSSSSSFILANNGEESVDITIPLHIDLREYSRPINTIQEFNEYLLSGLYFEPKTSIEDYLKDRGESFKERYRKSVEALEDGKTLWVGKVASDGYNQIEQIIYYRGWPQSPDYEKI